MTDFIGLWQMNLSTLYRNDRKGCITMHLSTLNEEGRQDVAWYEKTLYSWVPLNSGSFGGSSYEVEYN